jgi:hypothetical protein
VEVAAVIIAVPRPRTAWAARTAGSVVTGSARSVVARSTGSVVTGPARTVITRSTRPAGPVIARTAGPTGSVAAGSARAARPTGSGASWAAWPTRAVATSATWVLRSGSAVAYRGCAMATGLRPRRGAGRPGPHAQRGCPERAGDGRAGHQLLQFHGPSPVYLGIQRTLAPDVLNAK